MNDTVTHRKSLTLPVGVNGENEIETLPLPSYTLITGYGGGNRSGLLYRLVFYGVTQHTPDELNFWLYSPDAMYTFYDFRRYDIPHIVRMFSEESREETERFVVSLNEEIQRRFQLLLQTNRHSFQEYYEETGEELAPQMMVIVDFADCFHRHLYECKENIRYMMGEILLMAQALDVSVILCYKDHRIDWGYGIYPYYFQNRVAMGQENFSAEQTLNYKFQTDDPWQPYGTYWLSWPQPHPVRPAKVPWSDWEEELKKHFGCKNVDL